VSTNRKRLFHTNFLQSSGFDILKAREDVEPVPFPHMISSADLQKLFAAAGDVHGIIVGATRIGEAELAAAPALQVVARIGVGYDAIDVPELTRRQIPLMTVGTANSPSVAELAQFFMMALAKRGPTLHAMAKENRWGDRLKVIPMDLIGTTALVIGFGRIGTRITRRLLAMETTVLAYDPYVAAATIRAAGAEPVADLDAALPRADFVTIHCPKTPETTGMFDLARLQRMKPTAYLINTARGGIIDEDALYTALTTDTIAGAGIDVFASEPTGPDHPLLKLENVVLAPHMAGVTSGSLDRMAVQAVRNALSVFDGNPIRENVINPEVLV
jgi:D-3-phosphoglycerate dehydrogenase / 2-oxoglutarate reductase